MTDREDIRIYHPASRLANAPRTWSEHVSGLSNDQVEIPFVEALVDWGTHSLQERSIAVLAAYPGFVFFARGSAV